MATNKHKGIFLAPFFGHVPYDLANQAIDVPTTDNSKVLYYGKDCLLTPDYNSENAIRSELANVIKAAGFKYNPNVLDNLVRAILQLITIWGYTPDKMYDIQIPPHDVCNQTAEVVLTEKITKDGKTVNRLTRIPLDRLLKDLGKQFDITKEFDASLISGDINIDTKVVLERVNLKDGGVKSRLVTLPIQDLVRKYAPYKDLSKPFPETIEDKSPNDAIKIIAVKNVANGEHQLVKTDLKDFTNNLPFDPSQAFDIDLIEHFDPKLSFVLEGPTKQNKHLFFKTSIEGLAKWIVGPIASSYIKGFNGGTVIGQDSQFRFGNKITDKDTDALYLKNFTTNDILTKWSQYIVTDTTVFFPETRLYRYNFHLAMSPSNVDSGKNPLGRHAIKSFLIASDDKGHHDSTAKILGLPWGPIVGSSTLENATTYGDAVESIEKGYYRCVTVYLFAAANENSQSAVYIPPIPIPFFPPMTALLGIDFYNNFSNSNDLERYF